MRTARSHYEVLGLPRDATLTQIKRRYKELARKYHPDVAKDKETAHRLFLQIKDAYEALSDPVRRRAYDQTLAMDRPRQTTTTRTATSAGASRAQTSPPPGPLTPASKHVKDAQWAFIQHRFSEAVNHCKAALEIDSHNAKAYVVLGDIFRAQNMPNKAMKYYGYAMQYDPSDRETERKFEKLMGKGTARPEARVRSVQPGHATAMTVNIVWWGVAFFLLLLIGVRPGSPIPWLNHYIPQVSKWSWSLVGLMAGASAIVGMLLSLNGILSHPDEELVFESSGQSWAVVPTGLILMIGSGFFFLGAAGFYLAVGLLQGSLSRSVLIVFGAVVGIVLMSSLVYLPIARAQVMMYGGNISFLSMLIGWYVGSLFRPMNA